MRIAIDIFCRARVHLTVRLIHSNKTQHQILMQIQINTNTHTHSHSNSATLLQAVLHQSLNDFHETQINQHQIRVVFCFKKKIIPVITFEKFSS